MGWHMTNVYWVTERNRALIPAYRLVSTLLDGPDLRPNQGHADVLAGLVGSPVGRYNEILYRLAELAAQYIKLHHGPEQAQTAVLNAIAFRLDAEEQEIRQVFDSIIPPGKNNLTTAEQ
jgi:hypothetical protein